VPFVRICPQDLPGLIDKPFWIAAAPIGCIAGDHETVPCPAAVNLGLNKADQPPYLVQLVVAEHAHRTCSLRFGGKLPSAEERARALDALGLQTIAVTRSADGSLNSHVLPEWTTMENCASPSTIDRECQPRPFPLWATTALDWAALQACRSSVRTTGALRVAPEERCPPPTPSAPPCSFVSSNHSDRIPGVVLACLPAPLRISHLTDVATPNRAAFRCVVPEAALTGTIR
jgi:hypothetical protein